MKKITIILTTIAFFSVTLFAEDIAGRWHGLLNEHGAYSKVSLNITKAQDGYEAFFNSHDQKEENLPVSFFIFEEPVMAFKVIELAVEYKGYLGSDGNINGILNRDGLMFKVKFSRDSVKRRQDPAKPYPYAQEDVFFYNEPAGTALAGTLTMPYEGGPFAAVVLVSRREQHDRDGQTHGHKPFLVIADYLTRNGFAVLRYDDRGTGLSEGHFLSSTTMDFASDAQAAFEYLKSRKEIDAANAGIIGHGEGAVIAAVTASERKDVSFIVMLAGYGMPGKEILPEQKKAEAKAGRVKKAELKRDLRISKKAVEIMSVTADTGEAKRALSEYLSAAYDSFEPGEMPQGLGKVDFMRAYLNIYADPWMRFFLGYDPAETVKKVNCPVFAAWGAKDLQVPAKENLKMIKKALEEGGNTDFTVKIFPGLNHLFQECETGSSSEYAFIEQTFSPEVLSEISEWMRARIK